MAGLSSRQSQQEIRILKCKNAPMVTDLNKFSYPDCKYKNRDGLKPS
jgi:hypothetical protein